MSTEVTLLLGSIQRGDAVAIDDLLPLVYNELKEMARATLSREYVGKTMQTTAFVHEAYIRLVGKQSHQDWHNRKYFFAAAAQAMRRILVEMARHDKAEKRGGKSERQQLSLNEVVDGNPRFDFLEIDEALNLLAAQDAQAAELVQLRYFAGLPLVEAAELLEMSERSARRLWAYARAFLMEELSPNS